MKHRTGLGTVLHFRIYVTAYTGQFNISLRTSPKFIVSPSRYQYVSHCGLKKTIALNMVEGAGGLYDC